MSNNRLNLSICVWELEDTTPDAVTALLGLVPDSTYVKGARRRPDSEAVWHVSGWCRKSGVSATGTFTEHLEALCALIRPRTEAFARLAEKYHVEIACEVMVDTCEEVSTPWLHLTKEHTRLLGEVGIAVDVDLYRA